MNRRLPLLIMLAMACAGCNLEPSNPTEPQSHGVQETPPPPASPVSVAGASSENGLAAGRAEVAANQTEEGGTYVSVPAAGVKLIRPDGFEDAERFHGFQQPSTQSSVMITTIPGPFSEITGGFTADRLGSGGIMLHSSEDVEIDGLTGKLLHLSQIALGTRMIKWVVVFGDEDETKMITATFPKSSEADLSGKLKAVVLSTRLDDGPAPPPGADVGFSIVASPKLKPIKSISKTLVYTRDGEVPAKSPEDPIFMVAPSISAGLVTDTRQFAVRRLYQTAHTKIVSVTSITEITIDDLNGYEIVADATDTDSNTPLCVYQVFLNDRGSYILMVGLVGASIANEYLPEFKAMANSLTRDPQEKAQEQSAP